MGARRFGNGNINVKFDRSDIMDIRAGHVSDLEVFLWSLDEVDTCLIGEEYCISNFAMGITLYSAYSDRVFRFNMDDLERLRAGRTVKLYALEPDADDRELVAREFGD